MTPVLSARHAYRPYRFGPRPGRVRPHHCVRVAAVPGGWAWTCPAEHHGGRPGEVVGEVVHFGAYPCAWSAALALGNRHALLYHADGARLALALPLELVDPRRDDRDPGGPIHPPDPDAEVYHLEVCS